MNRFSALIFGGLVGATLALFLAPQSGNETRRRIRRTAEDLQGRAQDQLREGRMRMTELVRTGQEKVDEGTRRAEQQSRSALEQARLSADELSMRAEEQIQDLGTRRPDVGL